MQHTFNLHKNSVRLSVTHGGVQYRRSTGLCLASPSLWNPKAKSLRARCKDARILAALLAVHSRLCEMEQYAKTEDDVLCAIDYALSNETLMRMVAKRTQPQTTKAKAPTFWQFFDEWGERPSSSQRQRALAVRVIGDIMGRQDDWKEIDTAYWLRLNRAMESRGYSVNYRWNIGSRLKCAMHEGYQMKYHSNEDFREFKLHKERTDAVALTPSEIDLLWDYVPKNKTEGKVRDLALIGYYSATRFSDYSRLSLGNVRDGRLEFTQKKTGERVLLPAAPRLILLLERNGGHAPSVCQQIFNRVIKDIAKAVGIEGYITIRGNTIPRWQAVQSHTFRRSAVTALYLSGVSVRDCMMASGHRSISSFETYLKIGHEVAVERLAQATFFK